MLRALALLTVVLTTQLPVRAMPDTVLLLDFDRGSTTGDGQHFEWTEADGTFTATQFGGGNYVSVVLRGLPSGPFWVLQFRAPPGEVLAPGVYQASPYTSPNFPTSPQLSVVAGCVQSHGTFEIHELNIDTTTGRVLAFRARFEGRCNANGPATRGEVRFHSSEKLRITAPVRALASRGRELEFPIALDGAAARDADLDVTGLPQGASVTGRGDGLWMFRWTPPLEEAVAPLDLHFVASAPGAASSVATTRLFVRGSTWVRIWGEPGDWVGGGVTRGYRDVDGIFYTYVHPLDTSVWIHFQGFELGRFWDLTFGAPHRDRLLPGIYPGAVHWTSSDPSLPKLSVRGEGSACGSGSSGAFEVHEVRYSPDGELTSLWATFSQRCNEANAGLTGEILVNADAPLNAAPAARVTAPSVAECTGPDGAVVLLNGTASSDPDTDPLTFRWESQGVVFDDPTAPAPTGIFPLGTSVVELTVSDGLESSTTAVDVTVVDSIPPEIFAATTPAFLWPPNGMLHEMAVEVTLSDACDPNPGWSLASIEPDEPGSVEGAAIDTPDTAFRLRAVRQQDYTVTYLAHDASGNVSKAVATVTAPHDRRP